jgi:hypothetical protein
MPARWRGHCADRGGVSIAVNVTVRRPSGDKTLLYLNEPGRRGVSTPGFWETAGTCHRGFCGAGAGDGAALNITALVAGRVKAKPTLSLATNTWSEKRNVGWSFMPSAQTEQNFIWRGIVGSRGRAVSRLSGLKTPCHGASGKRSAVVFTRRSDGLIWGRREGGPICGKLSRSIEG